MKKQILFSTTNNALLKFFIVLFVFLTSSVLIGQTTYNYSYSSIGSTEAAVIQGHLNNGDNVVVSSYQIIINTNVNLLKSSGGPSTLTFKADFRVTMNINSSIKSTSDKLNVIFWANATNNSSTKGMIRMGDHTTANGNCIIETNGGHLWLGGGSNNVTWNGLTIGDGYAWGSASPGNLGWYGIELYGDCRLYTNGGNVAIKGRSTETFSQGATYGIYMIRSIINAGSGNIDVSTLTDGSSTSTANTTGIAVTGDGGFTTTTGNINISNTLSVTGNTGGTATGIYLERTTSGMPVITSNQGNVSISNNLSGTSASTKFYYDINETSVVKEKPSTATAFTELSPDLLSNSSTTYSSSSASVATVNNSGLVTLVGIGNTDIAGTFSSSAWNSVNSRWRYKLSVLNKADPSLSFNQNAIYKSISDPSFTISATQANQTGTVGTISYTSSNRSVATVNASTGQISIIGQGSTLITATSSSSATYVQGVASYTLYVTSGFVVFTNESSKSLYKVALTGNVVSDGGNSVTERGFVYATSSNPTILNSKITVGLGIGSFTGITPNLSPNTYYFKAYATNSSGTVYGSEFTETITSLSSLGCITVVASGGAGESTSWSYSDNVILPNSASNVNINASDIVSKLGLGSLTIAASCISIDSAILYTTNSNSISFVSNANVDVKASVTINGGNITFWADNDANGSGGIKVEDNVTIDSRTTSDKTNSTHTTGGGKITFAGGLDDGGTASGTSSLTTGLVSNDGIPDGYAVNSGSTATQTGIVLGTSSAATGHNSNIKIYSGGSEIKIYGLATNNSSAVSNGPTGILFFEGYTINSGTSGNITLIGNSNLTSGAYAIGMDLAGWRSTNGNYSANASVSTVNGNISIIGRAAGGTNENIALAIDGGTNRHVFAATGSGTISVDGLATGTSPLDVRLTNVDLLSGSGAITTNARGTSGIHIGGYNIGDGLYLGQKASSLVTSSSSNISLIGNNVQLTKPFNANSTGTLAIDSFSTGFTSNISLANQTIASTISGLTVGKLTNTATITFGTATTVAGPITAYGGTITLNANLTTTNSGAISLYTDNALGGLSTARTISAAGAFKYIPRGTSFAADVTYPIANLTSNSTGLTIGKSTNDKNITISADVTQAANVELYGNNLNINANVTTSAISAAMYLKGNTTIAAGKAITCGGNFTHDGNLLFKSDATGTAAFGTLGGTFTKVSGVATVERYVPAKRGWRLLTAPLKGSTANTINDNWRQGVTGEGLLLFSPATYQTTTMTGYTTGGGMPNIWNYDNGWQKIANINTDTMFGNNSTDTKAYLVFATGPQASTNIVTGATATTLKPKGDLISGSVSHSLTANQYKLIPNPYASPLNTEAMVQANPGTSVWMVDPTMSTVGGYYAYDGSNWTPTTPTNPTPANPTGSDKYIQSGQGFFVRKASAATFTISETHKVIGNSNTWFERTTSNQTTESVDKIRVLLYRQEAANWQLADGILAINYAAGNNDLDATDTPKMSNFNENILFKKGTTSLSMEYSALPQVGQIQPMYLTGTSIQPYQLQVFTEGYTNASAAPYLQDTTTGTTTAIPTDGTILTVPFTGIASSSTTPDQRFKIVYQSALGNEAFTSLWAAVYPNPVNNNIVNIQLKSINDDTRYTLTNLLGQTVQIGKLNALQNTITLPQLQEGMYMMTIDQEGKRYTTKLQIQN